MTSDVAIYQGDSVEVLQALAPDSVDAIVTDPPYALVSIGKRFGADDAAPAKSDGATGVYARAAAGFMGKRWDTGETAFSPAFWIEAKRVIKPGGHVAAFGGTRTYHRLACAIEDAGFEIRDSLLDIVASDAAVVALMDSLTPAQRALFVKAFEDSQFGGLLAWVYGTGFPKSHNAAKAIDDWLGETGATVATGAEVRRIRPGADKLAGGSWEKLEDRTFTPHDYVPATAEAAEWDGWGTACKPAFEPIVLARKPMIGPLARNLLAYGTGAINAGACRVAGGDVRSGGFGAGKRPWETGDVGGNTSRRGSEQGRWPANVVHDGSEEVIANFPSAAGQKGAVTGAERSHSTKNAYGNFGDSRRGMEPRGDEGSAARFFYSAKAGDEDRLGSGHPTVKPVELMAWLVRLLVRRGGVVLDPFAGSGSTGIAALGEGVNAILIELETESCDDIRRRVAWARGEGRLTSQEVRKRDLEKDPGKARGEDTPLFGGGLGK